MKSFKNLTTGESLPRDNPFAISCYFKTIEDIHGYEKNDPNILNKMQTGYPRFFCHPYEQELKQQLADSHDVSPEEIFLFASETGAKQAIQTLKLDTPIFKKESAAYLVHKDQKNELKLFIQHSGTKAFVRQVYDIIKNNDVPTDNPYEDSIKEALSKLYGVDPQDCLLQDSGMNATFSTFRAIKRERPNKKLFIVLGWLYLDTGAILKKYTEEHIEFINVDALDELETLIQTRGDDVAAVFTEVPTNPHLTTPDLEKLRAILNDKDILLVVDPTFGTPINIDVVPYADFIIESLSKFAGGHGDLLAGLCIAVSEEAKKLLPKVKLESTPLYIKDAEVLSEHIKDYEKRVQDIRKNVISVVQLLASHPKIKKVYWSHSDDYRTVYKKLEKQPNAYSGVISIEFFDEKTFIQIHDRLELSKGPSLGTEFTLVMAYFYMAHYHEVLDGSLQKRNISPFLLRVSLGTEPTEEIISRLKKALA